MESIARIYKITNILNGKSYVGFTQKTIEKRWKGHLSMAFADTINSHTPLYIAMQQSTSVTTDEFVIDELYASKNIDHCFQEMEQHFIREYDTMKPNGYNAKCGGKHHIRTKQKNNKCA